jgi:hypothetical protein
MYLLSSSQKKLADAVFFGVSSCPHHPVFTLMSCLAEQLVEKRIDPKEEEGILLVLLPPQES